jgi:putative ABC transport system permease protein
VRLAERIYALLLRCYPQEFRDEYAGEMTQAFRDGWGANRHARRWLDLAVDVARSAPKEHALVLLKDLRYAVRTLRRTPVFSAAVILTVALAIGANTAVFSIVNAVIIRPLPFEQPSRLVQVAEKNDRMKLPNFSASVLNYLSWKEQTQTLQLAALGFGTYALSGSGDPEQLAGSRITPSLMPVLGLQPMLGRSFTEEEEKPGTPRVAMIGEGLWKRRFGADPSIVGRALTLNGLDYTVVGIAPAALTVMTGGDVWTPLTIDPGREIRLNHVIFVAGRLRPGVTLEQAQAEMNTVASRLSQQYAEMKDWGVNLVTFHDTFVSAPLQTALLVLLAAVVCVLLIACANITNLLLARAAARQKEMAIRTAMGASRGRLLRQLLVESVTLSSIGGALGLLGAAWVVPAINASLPPNLLPIPTIPLDTTVLVFATATTLVTGILFGLAPSWRSTRADLTAVLKQAGRSSGVARPRLRNGLAAAELALATLLLVGASLLLQTLFQLQRARLGFEARELLTFQVAPPVPRYPLDSRAPAFYRSLVESLQSVSGVRAAAVSSGVPFGVGNYTTTPMMTTGTSPLPPETPIPTDWRIVTPGFFHTMGIPLLRGRDFTDADNSMTAPVTIVSQATAKRFWGDDDPLGRTLHRAADSRTFTVVGVVGDIRSLTLNQESPAMYYPAAARVWPRMDVVVRADGDPEALLPAIRQKVHELDAQLPLANIRTMEQWVSNTAAQPRLNAQLLAVFAGVALLIAAIGIYGVLAYSVNQRTREIGLRMALGAQPEGVLRLVVGEGMLVAIAGVAIGLVAALVLSRTLSSLLFEVPERDPGTFAGVAIVLLLVAVIACVMPARRASRVDPMIALREE